MWPELERVLGTGTALLRVLRGFHFEGAPENNPQSRALILPQINMEAPGGLSTSGQGSKKAEMPKGGLDDVVLKPLSS